MGKTEKQYSRFTNEYAVRPDDIDMFQHVHNSRYFDYVLAARYDQMQVNYGMSMDAFLEMGYGWVVRTAYVEYKRPLKLGDRFLVETGIVAMLDRGCEVTFEIRQKTTDKIVCTGKFEYVLINLKTGRSSPILPEMIEKYSV